MTGEVVADGVRTGGLSFEAAGASLDRATAGKPATAKVADVMSAYGCNMVVRRAIAAVVSFDERMAGYALYEDFDFSRRCAAHGRVVAYAASRAAHMGAQSGGRLAHERYGYAQIASPYYLWRKGTMPFTGMVWFWLRAAKNLRNAAHAAEGPWRRARLRGNCDALKQLTIHRRRTAVLVQ